MNSINNLRCLICNHNLVKIKTLYLFDFYFEKKQEFIYLCNNHNSYCDHKYLQKTNNNITNVEKIIIKKYENNNNNNILYDKRVYNRIRNNGYY